MNAKPRVRPRPTARELRVLEGLYCGYAVYEIAEQLNVAYRTVSTHMLSLHKKYGVRNAASLMRAVICEASAQHDTRLLSKIAKWQGVTP